MQGRKWLSKSGGASSNMAAMAAPSILPKGGGGRGGAIPSSYAPVLQNATNLTGAIDPINWSFPNTNVGS